VKKRMLFLIVFLCVLVTSNCSTPATPPATTVSAPSKEDIEADSAQPIMEEAADQIETDIQIDGDPSDWWDYPVLTEDPQGDVEGGDFDIASVRGFMNDRFLYLMVDTYQLASDYAQVDLDISAGGGEYIASFQPQNNSPGSLGDVISGKFEEIGNMGGSRSAAFAVVELKMPLSVFGEPTDLQVGIRTMGGECCQAPGWYAIDEISEISIPIVDEVEPSMDLTIPPKSAGEDLLIEQTQVDLTEKRGDEPTDLVMSSDGMHIYTIGRNTDTLFVIDGTTNQITEIIELKGINNNPFGVRPDKLALTNDDTILLIANFNDESVSLFDTNTRSIPSTIPVQVQPADVEVSIKGDVFVPSRNAPKIAVFNINEPDTIDFINLPVPAFAVAPAPDGKIAYAASSEGIFEIEVLTKSIKRTIPLPFQAFMGNLIINSAGSTIFLTALNTNQVLEIDILSGQILQSYPVQAAAQGLALNEAEDKLFVGTFTALMESEYTAAVIDLNTNSISHTIEPLSPAEHVSWVPAIEGLAVNSNDQAYLATVDADAIFITDNENYEHIATIPLTAFAKLQPVQIAISLDGKWLYTANAAPQAASVSKISTIDNSVSTFTFDDASTGCLAQATGLDVDEISGTVFMTAGNCLMAFDPKTDAFTSAVPIKSPTGDQFRDVDVHPDGKRAFLLDDGGGLTSVNLADMTVMDFNKALPDGYNLKISPDGEKAYITGSSEYAVVDANAMEVMVHDEANPVKLLTEMPQFSNYPDRLIGIDPRGEYYMIGNFMGIQVFDEENHRLTKEIDLDEWSPHRQLATDVIFTPDGSSGYLALWDMKGIVAFDPTTWQVKAKIDTGSAPFYVVCPGAFAMNPDGSRLYVTGEQSDNIMVIDTTSNKPIDVIKLIP